MSRRNSGFTLLEIMVALVVFGFLMIGLTQGVHFGLRAWTGQARLFAKRGDLDAVDRTLRGLIARMDPGFAIDPPNIVGQPHGFAFTTTLPRGAPRGAPGGAPGGASEADISLTLDHRHDLLLRWTPHLHAVRLAGTPIIHRVTLLHHVASLDFGYWNRAGGRWLATWNRRTPPALVRITIKFRKIGPGSQRRRWPAIVVAPMRVPAG